MVSALEEQPDASFPKVFNTDATLEGFYRLIGNRRMEWNVVFMGHVDSTVRRAKPLGRALALHDSSLFQFGGTEARDGCFRTAKNKSGFVGHTCLAVSADGRRQPLGLLGMIPVVRLKGERAPDAPPRGLPRRAWHACFPVHPWGSVGDCRPEAPLAEWRPSHNKYDFIPHTTRHTALHDQNTSVLSLG